MGKVAGAEKMSDVLSSMQKYMPGVIDAISGEQGKVAQTQADTDKLISPQYAQMQADLYSKYGPQLNKVGQEIDTSNQLAASAREKQIADQYGPDLVSAANKLQEMTDPEFYAGRSAVGRGINNLVQSQDPNTLSGSERAEVDRAVGRSGVVNPNSTANAVANAMTFGDALQKKQQGYANILGMSAQALPQLKSGLPAFEIATRRALTPNSGNQVFMGAQQGAGQNAWNTGNNFFNQASNMQTQGNLATGSILDQVVKGTKAFSNVVGSFSGV